MSEYASNYGDFAAFKGPNDGEGPVSVLLGGVHGGERTPIEVVRQVMHEGLVVDNGTVLAGLLNLDAIDAWLRQVEFDANRIILKSAEGLSPKLLASREYRRVQVVKAQALNLADNLLDIHSVTLNPRARPMALAEPNAYDLAECLPVDDIVSGVNNFHGGSTDDYVHRRGGKTVALEIGWDQDPNAFSLAQAGIRGFLGAAGHIDETTERRGQRKHVIFDMYTPSRGPFTFTQTYEGLTELPAGHIIGYEEGAGAIATPRDATIIFPGNGTYKVGDPAFMLADRIS